MRDITNNRNSRISVQNQLDSTGKIEYLLEKLVSIVSTSGGIDVARNVPLRAFRFFTNKTETQLPSIFIASTTNKVIEINHCLVRSPVGTIEVDIYLHSNELKGIGYDYGGLIMASNHGYQTKRYNINQLDNLSFYFTIMGDPRNQLDIAGQDFYNKYHSNPINDPSLLPEVTPYTFMIEMTLHF